MKKVIGLMMRYGMAIIIIGSVLALWTVVLVAMTVD